MQKTHIDITRLVIILCLVTIAVAVASLTVGRDIYENKELSLLSFGILNFAGYLFFLIMPVELAFMFYLHSGYDPLVLNLVAVLTAILSQTIDYMIGYYFSSGIIDKLIGRKRYKEAEAEIRKYGILTIIVFNLFPLSSPVISLAAGMLKYPIKEVIIFSMAGLIGKYVILSLIF
ncbi:MAG: VTT domain-containing protein [Prolixibacteraceae bacterium]